MITKRSIKTTTLQCVILFYAITFSITTHAGGDASIENLAMLEKKSATILAEIKQQIGPASCESNEQCRALPIGHRACGGPATYLAYSIRNVDEIRLTELAKQHTTTEREINRLKNRMSTCDVLMPPPVMCDAGVCISH